MTKDDLIAFENRVAEHWLEGDINSLFHQSGGNEDALLAIFQAVKPGDYVLASHRSHYHYLLKTGDEAVLMQKILDGRSMFLFSKEHRFLSSSVLGGICGIAAGIALAIKMKGEPHHVWAFCGDGALDNGHAYESLRFAESADLPMTLVVEDNNRSCDSSQEARGATAFILNSKKLRRYCYAMTVPHCQTASKQQVVFKNQGKNE